MAETVDPDPARAAIYDELYGGGYESLYRATNGHMHLLAGVQRRGAAARDRTPVQRSE